MRDRRKPGVSETPNPRIIRYLWQIKCKRWKNCVEQRRGRSIPLFHQEDNLVISRETKGYSASITSQLVRCRYQVKFELNLSSDSRVYPGHGLVLKYDRCLCQGKDEETSTNWRTGYHAKNGIWEKNRVQMWFPYCWST